MDGASLNCSLYPPSAYEVVTDGSLGNILVLTITGLCTCVILGVYVEQVIYVKRHWWSWSIRDHKLCLLAIYPVIGALSFLGIIIPRSTVLVDLVASVYVSVCIKVFHRLMICYFGGSARMLRTLSEHDLVLRSPPCCCCLCCLPTTRLTPKALWWINVSVFQMVIIRPILMLLAAVMWTDGIYIPGQVAIDKPEIYIQFLNGITTTFALYGLLLIYRISRIPLKKYHITVKFISLKLVLLVTSLQTTIIMIVQKSGAITCTPLFNSVTSGERINHVILVIEMLLLSFLAMWSYRREIPPPGGDHNLNDEEEESETKNLSFNENAYSTVESQQIKNRL